MARQENLEMLRESGASYLVGMPKSMLREFERELLRKGWTHIEPGVDVKLYTAPDGTAETFVLCRCPQRSQKERVMRERQIKRLETELEKLQARCKAVKNPLREVGKAERWIGALLQRYSRAAHLYEVRVEQADEVHGKKRLTVHILRHPERSQWAELADGFYLLRANLAGTLPMNFGAPISA